MSVLNDFSHAFRSLLRARGFLATATLCLALGIGANLAVLSHVDRLVLRPLPFPEGGRLVVLEPADVRTGDIGPMTMPEFEDLRTQGTAFQGMAACTARTRTLVGLEEPLRVDVGMVTADFFKVLGVAPALGRVAFSGEEAGIPASVAVLRHEFWMSRFGGDRGILGRTLELDGKAVQVVGVLPAGFRFFQRISGSQVFVPEARAFGARTPGMGTFLAIARLKPGATLGQAQAEAAVIAGRTGAREGNPRYGVRVSTLLDRTVANYGRVLLLFQGAVVLVLLITCFNVAGLQVVRNMARSRDMAIRQALGAGQGRLGRLFVVEGLVLAGLGGLGGVVLSFYLQQGLARLVADLVPVPDAAVYPELLLMALALTLVTGLGLGLISWAMARGQRVAEALKAGARGSQTRGHWRVLRGLVVAEVALSVVLLLGAGLLIHSLINLQRVDPGFQPGPVLTLNVPLPPAKYGLAGQRAFLERLEPALLAVPGVEAVGVNDTLPFVKATNAGNVSAEKGVPRSTGAAVDVRTHVVTSGYFKAMGIPLVAGGAFPPAEADACMISQRLAQRLWPGQEAVGRLLYSGFSDPLRVVGVVGDTAENMLGKAEDPQVYQPAAFSELFEGPVVVMKVKGDPGQYRSQVKAVLRSLDPGLALPDPKPLAQVLRESLIMQSVASTLFAVFGLLALLLSGVGLYGVLAQVGEQKHREIGIRMSLGATRLQVVGGVLSGAGVLVGAGLILGALLGWRLELALGPLLFGLKGAGPLIYLGILLFLVPTALLACLLPALRAARVDPAQALRSE